MAISLLQDTRPGQWFGIVASAVFFRGRSLPQCREYCGLLPCHAATLRIGLRLFLLWQLSKSLRGTCGNEAVQSVGQARGPTLWVVPRASFLLRWCCTGYGIRSATCCFFSMPIVIKISRYQVLTSLNKFGVALHIMH